MSRSYKHVPMVKYTLKDMKYFANRRIRHIKDIPSGGAYKKFCEQYDICDMKSCCTYKRFHWPVTVYQGSIYYGYHHSLSVNFLWYKDYKMK